MRLFGKGLLGSGKLRETPLTVPCKHQVAGSTPAAGTNLPTLPRRSEAGP